MKINPHKTIATLALVMMTTAVTFATGTLSIPHTFSAGQTAVATEVNANFQSLVSAINDLRAKVTGQYDGADNFAVTSVTVANGDVASIDGRTYPIMARSVISFEEGNNTQYSIIAPFSNTNGLFVTQSNPTNFDDPTDKFQKTTINGFPALMGVSFSNDERAISTSSSASCRVQIKLDSTTYLMLAGNYPETLSSPITKAQQTAAASMCKALLNYISITTTSAI